MSLDGREISSEEECEPFTDRYQIKHFKMPEVVWTKMIGIKFYLDYDGFNENAAKEMSPNDKPMIQFTTI
jgi:putative IMPACT (imprinted ancient) family translation regulator